MSTFDAAGIFPSAFSAPYTASKFAALALTESLAGELAASGAPIGKPTPMLWSTSSR